MMTLDQLKEITREGTTAVHREGLDAQYQENLKHSKIVDCPVFNVFYMGEPTTLEDGTLHFAISKQYYSTRDELPLTHEEAQPLIEQFHFTKFNQTN